MKPRIAEMIILILLSLSYSQGRRWSLQSVLRLAHQEAMFLEEEEARVKDSEKTNENSNLTASLAFLTSSNFVKEVGNLAREQRLVLELLHNITGFSGDALFKLLQQELGCLTLLKNSEHIVSEEEVNVEKDSCPFSYIECDADNHYRTIDGSCNNLYFPLSGKANRAQARLLEPDYADKISAPRAAKSGKALPSARAVSLSISDNHTHIEGHFTSMHMTFGQLVDHDTDRTPMTMALINDTLVKHTCGSDGCETAGLDNEPCYPIPVDSEDPDFDYKDCLLFVRSQEYITDSCQVGPRQQPNAITSWLDASFVYGSDRNLMNRLRDFSDPTRGKLKVTPNEPFKPLLPQQDHSMCRDVDDRIRCFLTGDSRENEQVALMAMHIVFVRLHNLYEEQLHQVNPHWGAEKLFQESRRLLIAVWQHIVFNEYLPVVLGPLYCRENDLILHRIGYYKGYKPEIYGDVFNVFSTAAFRFGHSQIGNSFLFTDSTYQKKSHIPLSSLFFRPRTIYESPIENTTGTDAVLLGSVSQSVEAVDKSFSEEVSSKLFTVNPPHGKNMDLVSLNIQRGRDHGLPGYTAWRKFCGLSVPKTFKEIDSLPIELVEKFEELYEHVEDIDLYPAAIAEPPVHSGLVGETFACLIAHQFEVLRKGDRYWYETNDEELRFTPEQLQNIREMTLSRLLCDTLDNVQTIQKYSMVAPWDQDQAVSSEWFSHQFMFKGSLNKRVPCHEHPNLDFSLWKE